MLRRMTIPAAILLLGFVWPVPAQSQPRIRPGIGGPRAGGRPNKRLLEKYREMSPEQRRQATKNLPPERRKAIEERMEQYDHLPPDERRRLEGRLENFQQWSPERQQMARRVIQRVNQVPPERRQLIRDEFQSWHSLSDDDVRSRMNSDEFRNKYNAQEQQLLREMAKLKSTP